MWGLLTLWTVAAATYFVQSKLQAFSWRPADITFQPMLPWQRARLIITDDIAQAGYAPLPAQRVAATLHASAFRLILQGDFNASNTLGDTNGGQPPEVIEYRYDQEKQELWRNQLKLLQNLESFAFHYQLLDGTSTSQPEAGDIQSIRIQWQLSGQPMQWDVAMRNLP